VASRNSRYHPLILLPGEIALFISGFQDASILHNETKPSRKMQAAEKFLRARGKQIGLPDLAP
jgi:hypothetical protein